MIKIKKLHHSAYRCKDTSDTKKFYVDFLGLKLTKAFIINTTKTKRKTRVLHSFYGLNDGSAIAFFEDPNTFFEFKNQRDFDLHIAFEVTMNDLVFYLEKAKKIGIESRGISDHGFIKSVYFRDPNGYVIELSAPADHHKQQTIKDINKVLKEWELSK
ncbi:MAG: lactoylglutathione lyase [Pelagibacterales bacterium]|nr:lactoylglutathione lyase [Pelagibacterales bacterium]|tara:strand:+ start:329 stop:802 length:474 start_codon:yes stop_codon:yes gene_type:complete